MRVLLATLGSRGDVEPFLWLARALQEDGHTVRVLGPDEVDQGTDDLD
ncbi:MAG: glycosyltransferase, partial [Propionibacteriaceae bacterium]